MFFVKMFKVRCIVVQQGRLLLQHMKNGLVRLYSCFRGVELIATLPQDLLLLAK